MLTPTNQGRQPVLKTALCDLLGIDVPILLAPMGAGATSAEFAAAVPTFAHYVRSAGYQSS